MLKLRFFDPFRREMEISRELSRRNTDFANAFIAAGRPPDLTTKTAQYLHPNFIPSALVNQAIRNVVSHPEARRYRFLPPGYKKSELTFRTRKGVWFLHAVWLRKQCGLGRRNEHQQSN